MPEITSALQVLIDERRHETGRFVLTGSHQTKLFEAVSQSLAGRTSVLSLFPPDLSELADRSDAVSTDELLVRGFMPDLWVRRTDPARFYRNYYRTYVERDVRQLVMVENQHSFEVFVRLLAGRVGQLVNLESMSGDVGVSAHTLKKWLSVLEASYIVFRLQPYYANCGKRLVKTPKIYFSDVGLAAHLLGIGNGTQVLRDPLVGGLFENLVVAEAMKWRSNGRRFEDFYFFRDSNGLEVDLVMESARRLHLMEIKFAMTPNPSLERAIRRVAAVTSALSKTIVYRGEGFPIAGGGEYVNFGNMASRLDELAGKRDVEWFFPVGLRSHSV